MKVQALERCGSKLRFIDQTALPVRLVQKETDDYLEIIAAIKRLEIRGAPAIGIAAAYALAVAVTQQGAYSTDLLVRLGSEIKAARPTAVNLFWAVDRVLDKMKAHGNVSAIEASRRLWQEAEAIHDEDREMCARIGRHGSELIRDGATVLTHCNTGALATGGIGTALGVIYTCRDQGKRIKVYADETRPLLQGSRLTAWELQQEGIDVTLICDNTAGMLMRQGKIDAVLVGADRIARNGDTANKIGTYSVAVLAKEHGVPFYVAAPSSTFDPGIENGSQIVIEERSAKEVIEGLGTLTAPSDIKVYSPAFDVTPNGYITAHITDQGVKPGGRP
ncbi:MAG: S-methyl-5-thioribose-1-phosphate isomerase [candidate division Zixibacteria bacterium]|nr:S-methyl-5-thioribose-1-phosphate isomerase [candidate division Zixibacteria bacterium]